MAGGGGAACWGTGTREGAPGGTGGDAEPAGPPTADGTAAACGWSDAGSAPGAGAAEGESAASAWAQEALRSIVEDEFPALLQREVAQMRRSMLGLGRHPEVSAVAEGGDGGGGSGT